MKRTIAVSAPLALYTSAEQIADFDAVQSAVSVEVYQTNAIFGRGSPRAAVV